MSRNALRWGAPLVVALLVLAYASARRPRSVVQTATRLLMDTVVSVSVWGVDEQDAPGVFEAAFAELVAVDREMAREDSSPLVELNADGGGSVREATGAVLAAALAWADRTGGAFDPTTAALLDLWDILSGPHPPPSEAELAAAQEHVGWRRVTLAADHRRVDLGGTGLDLGGIAKGYGIDKAAGALRAAGVSNFLVNAGGDLYLSGSKGGEPWRVGIQHPRAPETLLRVVTPGAGALVTSGDYERSYQWEGVLYHHILDPRTGEPARDCQSVTVWAATAMDADALATAVFVLGPGEGLQLVEDEPAAEALVVTSAGEVLESTGFSTRVPEAPPR